MRLTTIASAIAGAALLALAASAAAQSLDEDGCFEAPNCVTVTSEWRGDDFVTRYTNVCNKRVYMKFCNQALGLTGGESCGASGLQPGDTKRWRTSGAHDPTGQYAWAWVESTKVRKDWVCSDRWGLSTWGTGW